MVAAGAAALGYLTNDLAAPGLVGGLVLIVMLIGFTVMQFAFSGSGGAMDSGPDAERRSLAMTGSGEAIFDWNVLTDEVNGSEVIESQLGLKRGASKGRPPAGSMCCIPSIATATRWRWTGSCISAPGGSTTI